MGIYREKRQQHLGTQKRVAQLSRARRGQRHRSTGHRTPRRKSNPGNTSRKNKKGYEKKPIPGQEKKNGDSPAILRRWTSWSNARATGWSQGNVLAQSRNSFQVQRLNRARRQSFLTGRCHNIFNVSNNMAMGMEYSTIEESVPTILTSTTEQSGMTPF